MGEGSGRGSGRVGSDFLSAIAGRVGSGQRFAGSGSGRVQEKWPVDNSGSDCFVPRLKHQTSPLHSWVSVHEQYNLVFSALWLVELE